MRIIFLLLFSFLFTTSKGQNSIPTFQSNQSLEFSKFLSGVKYAYITFDDKDIKFIKENPTSGNAYAIGGLIEFLIKMGFEEVKWGSYSDKPQTYPSNCDMAFVIPSWSFKNNYFYDISLKFSSCKNDDFIFKTSKQIWVNSFTNITTAFHNIFIKMYGYKKTINLNNRLTLNSQITEWTEDKLKNYFKDKGADAIEGIYEDTEGNEINTKYRVGIIKKEFGYNIIYFDGASNKEDWRAGELKAKLYSTATPTLFKAEWYMRDKQINKDAYITFEDGLMNLVLTDIEKDLYIKLFPSYRDNVKTPNDLPVSGSGFAISSDGLIVTNHHVTNGSKSIKIKGINNDFNKSYNAKLVIEDKNNDLAILKIDDPFFTSLGVIPYVINTKTADVGSSIFVLGYPLRSTMGDEIKLTDGVISSKSGFQGDVTSYQISAPIQPGNSGGPLFDNKGNLIGIVNAKHSNAENASYAIKASYLLNLIELMNINPKLQTVSTVSNKPLIEQVKLLKKVTFIIEIN
jgi:hypothetical protein